MPVYLMDPSRARRRSRLMAFRAQGITLRYPSHSWSGVRGDGEGGVVVVAIRAADVHVHDWGCSCLLWSPASGPGEALDRASHQERLEHCLLAVCHGTADALVAYGQEAGFNAGEVIALSVVKVGDQYWARWGSVARAEGSTRYRLPGMRPAEACLAA